MTRLFILLTGYLLFGQPTYSVAQKNVQLQHCCEKIMKAGPWIGYLGAHSGKMRFRLLGIYSHGSTIFFLLRLNNRSPLDYDIDSVRFCIAERARTLPAAPPGILRPVYVYDSTSTVPGYRRATTIYVLPRFTLPAGRRLQIILRERNGGRHLRIQTGNAALIRARLI
ncbi:DUF4138 domain-containing protein [Puia sp.]|jgi:hypothetical protein|uniref:DUF4138 domain-containing protein n=1 Tax=Puia sp. TaxID=2045100 RepID=UPI002F404D55